MSVISLLAVCLLAVLPTAAGTETQPSFAPAQEVTIRSSLDGTDQPALFYAPAGTARGAPRRPVPVIARRP
jgi:hypothetical protein